MIENLLFLFTDYGISYFDDYDKSLWWHWQECPTISSIENLSRQDLDRYFIHGNGKDEDEIGERKTREVAGVKETTAEDDAWRDLKCSSQEKASLAET